MYKSLMTHDHSNGYYMILSYSHYIYILVISHRWIGPRSAATPRCCFSLPLQLSWRFSPPFEGSRPAGNVWDGMEACTTIQSSEWRLWGEERHRRNWPSGNLRRSQEQIGRWLRNAASKNRWYGYIHLFSFSHPQHEAWSYPNLQDHRFQTYHEESPIAGPFSQ